LSVAGTGQNLDLIGPSGGPGQRSIDAFSGVHYFSLPQSGLVDFIMNVETNVALQDSQKYKLVCEQCGSLTVALPIEAQPNPCSILKCGRCGSPRGTLQSLRDTSIQAGIELQA
jgi:hypothetical protein